MAWSTELFVLQCKMFAVEAGSKRFTSFDCPCETALVARSRKIAKDGEAGGAWA